MRVCGGGVDKKIGVSKQGCGLVVEVVRHSSPFQYLFASVVSSNICCVRCPGKTITLFLINY